MAVCKQCDIPLTEFINMELSLCDDHSRELFYQKITSTNYSPMNLILVLHNINEIKKLDESHIKVIMALVGSYKSYQQLMIMNLNIKFSKESWIKIYPYVHMFDYESLKHLDVDFQYCIDSIILTKDLLLFLINKGIYYDFNIGKIHDIRLFLIYIDKCKVRKLSKETMNYLYDTISKSYSYNEWGQITPYSKMKILELFLENSFDNVILYVRYISKSCDSDVLFNILLKYYNVDEIINKFISGSDPYFIIYIINNHISTIKEDSSYEKLLEKLCESEDKKIKKKEDYKFHNNIMCLLDMGVSMSEKIINKIIFKYKLNDEIIEKIILYIKNNNVTLHEKSPLLKIYNNKILLDYLVFAEYDPTLIYVDFLKKKPKNKDLINEALYYLIHNNLLIGNWSIANDYSKEISEIKELSKKIKSARK